MSDLHGDDAAQDNIPARPGRRVRSRVACQSCNRRKVRCDVAETSRPCSNCQRDGVECIVLPRKKHRPRRTRAKLAHLVKDQDSYHTASPEAGYGGHLTPKHSDAVSDPRHLNDLTSSEDDQDHFTAQGPQDDTIMPDDSSYTYLGDKRGPRCNVYDICEVAPPQDSRLYLPPKEASLSLYKPNQVEYMRSEGVFATLSLDVCDDMIHCYFKHVHFFLPIVDAEDFLNEYHRRGPDHMHDLLFWSMMLAAANFADVDLLRRAGFNSRKAMKTAMYERAKCLYDLDRATEKLKLIQSVLLLSFWYTDPQDHTGAWYWIGIAISLAQGIGLHRFPRSSNRSPQPSPQRQALMRRIWWACLVRDRWVSLAKGRPMRIHSEDCDTPMPSPQDVLHELDRIVDEAREHFIPADSAALTGLWLRFVRISDILGGILRLHYRVCGPDISITEINRYQKYLETLSAVNSGILDEWDDALSIHAYQIDLFYQATVAILYRPYALNESTPLPSGATPDWHKVALRRARDAAANTNAVMQSLIELDAIKYLKPMIITAMIPAMQIHLSDCKSKKPLIQGLAKHRLQLCMLVLSSLRVTYWSADVMYRLFDRAQNILSRSKAFRSANLPGRQAQTEVSSSPHSLHRSEGDSPAPGSLGYQHEIEGLPMADMNLMSEDNQQLWFTVSPQLSNVDQLLSPGFSLSEDVFQDFFPNYDGRVYGQHMASMSSKPMDDMMYNNIAF